MLINSKIKNKLYGNKALIEEIGLNGLDLSFEANWIGFRGRKYIVDMLEEAC